MIQLKKVLFPTDLSDAAAEAQKYAFAVAGQFQAELHIVSVVQDAELLTPDPNAPFLIPSSTIEDVAAEVTKSLEQMQAPAGSPGLKIVRKVVTGLPYQEIVEYAKTQEIDLIVLGTHGRSGFVHLLLGSVAEKVVRSAPCPVLTVHPHGHQFVAE